MGTSLGASVGASLSASLGAFLGASLGASHWRDHFGIMRLNMIWSIKHTPQRRGCMFSVPDHICAPENAPFREQKKNMHGAFLCKYAPL